MMSLRVLVVSIVFLGLSLPAYGQTITSRNETTPWAGVRVVEGRTSGPNANFYATFVDLCHQGIKVDASTAGGARTASSYANATGARVAVNGDFYGYQDGNSFVYGDAVGQGNRWPGARSGRDSRYSSGWFYQRYGWIAFGDGWVQYNHTKWAKENPDAFGGTLGGWRPNNVTTAIPEGTRALVSGFSQLVAEGRRYTCSNPTASSCFPDRSDMRARHPRTAMGLTQDKKTFILVVVDGRSTQSAGMYGTELAKLMHDLGAHFAINLDGGGSSQMFVQGRGTINRPSDGSPRSVLNHWGIFTGQSSGSSCDTVTEDLLQQSHIFDSLAHTDITGDGHADVCGRGPDGIECFLGADGFETRVEGPRLADSSGWHDPTNHTTIRMGDVDGDGRADICARANAGIRCWLSDGNGFPERIIGPELSNALGFDKVEYFSTLRLADVNGDGLADICVRTSTDFRCYPSTGDGFGAPIIGPELSDAQGWNRPERYGTIRMSDVTGNGMADVCALDGDGFRCWLSQGDRFEGEIEGPGWSDENGWRHHRYWSTLRLIDVDGDGLADVCARNSRDFRCMLSDGRGFPQRVDGPALADESGWDGYDNYSTIRMADIDGDGRADVCARANAGMRCWLFDGEAFTTRIDGPLANETGWHRERFFRTIRVGDVNADGHADICARSSNAWHCWVYDPVARNFDERWDGQGWSDASGWNDPRLYSTIRFASPRPEPPMPDPDPDDPANPGTPTHPQDPSNGGVGEDVPGHNDVHPGLDTNDENLIVSTGSCACAAAQNGPTGTLPWILMLFGSVLWTRRKRLARDRTV